MKTVSLDYLNVKDIIGDAVYDLQRHGDKFAHNYFSAVDMMTDIAESESMHRTDGCDQELFVWASTRCGYVAPFVKKALVDTDNENALFEGLQNAYADYLYDYLYYNYEEFLFELVSAYLKWIGIVKLSEASANSLKQVIIEVDKDRLYDCRIYDLLVKITNRAQLNPYAKPMVAVR